MRKLVKNGIFLIALLLISPILFIVEIGKLVGLKYLFNTFAEFLSLFPGRIGSYLRVAYYSVTLEKMSQEVVMEFGSFFSRRTAVVGKKVYIGAYCILGNVDIKDDVLIASRVSIPSGKNQHGSSTVQEKNMTEDEYNRVSIGKRTWLGEGSIIMADIGDDVIIGSGSVVTKPIPNRCVAVGNPAKPRMERNI